MSSPRRILWFGCKSNPDQLDNRLQDVFDAFWDFSVQTCNYFRSRPLSYCERKLQEHPHSTPGDWCPCLNINSISFSTVLSLITIWVFLDEVAHVPDRAVVLSIYKSIRRYEAIAQHVECMIGSFGHRIAFLHQDDWVCSADAQSFEVDSFDRHFFFPGDWLSATGPDGSLILGIFSRTGTIVFVQRNEVAIVHKGMEYFKAGQSKGTRKRRGLGRLVKSDPLPNSKLPFTPRWRSFKVRVRRLTIQDISCWN
jgi:hypothetical protein